MYKKLLWFEHDLKWINHANLFYRWPYKYDVRQLNVIDLVCYDTKMDYAQTGYCAADIYKQFKFRNSIVFKLPKFSNIKKTSVHLEFEEKNEFLHKWWWQKNLLYCCNHYEFSLRFGGNPKYNMHLSWYAKYSKKCNIVCKLSYIK